MLVFFISYLFYSFLCNWRFMEKKIQISTKDVRSNGVLPVIGSTDSKMNSSGDMHKLNCLSSVFRWYGKKGGKRPWNNQFKSKASVLKSSEKMEPWKMSQWLNFCDSTLFGSTCCLAAVWNLGSEHAHRWHWSPVGVSCGSFFLRSMQQAKIIFAWEIVEVIIQMYVSKSTTTGSCLGLRFLIAPMFQYQFLNTPSPAEIVGRRTITT